MRRAVIPVLGVTAYFLQQIQTMIRQEIHLERAHGWKVTCYYAVTHYETDEIIQRMMEAGANADSLARAYDNLSSGNPDTGLCFSGDGESVLVISVTSSAEEFADSLAHEQHHLASQIGSALGWNLLGEDVCYLAGEIGRKMSAIASRYLCGHCRKH